MSESMRPPGQAEEHAEKHAAEPAVAQAPHLRPPSRLRAGGHEGRAGLFRPVAVERYAQPLESDVPEQLVRWRPGWVVAGVAALAIAVLLVRGL